jgi:small subunit ribosomal protein S36
VTVVEVPPAEAAEGSAVAAPGAREGDGPGEPARGRPLRPPRLVWLAMLLFALVGALWTVAVPAFRAPDEPAHLDLVLYLAEGNSYPAWDGRYFGEAMQLDTVRYLIDSHYSWPKFDAADAPPRANRPDVDDLGGLTPDANARHPDDRRAGYPYVYNQMPQHPPLYYEVMAGVIRFERWVLPGTGPPSLDRELGLLRLINVLLAAPLPLLAWATVVRLGGGERAARVASLLPLGLPQLSYIGAALNNDNLLTLLGGVLAVLLAGVARGRRTYRTDLAVGVTIGLALLTKAFALVFVPWLFAAYALGAWTTRSATRSTPGSTTRWWRDHGIGALIAGGVAAAVGTWWWIANWVRFGEPAPTSETLTHTTAQRPPGFQPDLVGYAWAFAGRLVSRAWLWVGFRNPKIELAPLLVAALTLAVVVAAVVAVRRASPGLATDGGPRRWDLALACLATLLTVVFVFRRAWHLHETTGGWPFIQGRYLFGTIVGPMAVVALGAATLLGRRAVGVAIAAIVALQAWSLAKVLDGAWTGPGAFGPLRGALAWSPWPPAVVGLVAVIALVTSVALGAHARRT